MYVRKHDVVMEVWGYAPPEKILNLLYLRLPLVASETHSSTKHNGHITYIIAYYHYILPISDVKNIDQSLAKQSS